MSYINLLPADYLKRDNKLILFYNCAFAALIVLMFAGYFILKYYKDIGERKLLNVKAEYSQTLGAEENSEELEALKKTADELQSYTDMASEVENKRKIYAGFFKSLTESLPSVVWVSSLNASYVENVLNVSLKVSSKSPTTIVKWVDSLSENGAYSEVKASNATLLNSEENVYTLPLSFTFSLKKVQNND